MRNLRFFMLSITTILVMILNATTPTVVFADDNTPADPQTTETEVVDTPEVEGDEDTTTESPVGEGESVVETATPDIFTTEQPVVDPAEQAPGGTATEDGRVEETPSDGMTEMPVEETGDGEMVFLPDVLDQAPEGTNLVIVNEDGEIEPMVTTEAEEILNTGDPMWCPEGASPGDAGCTASYNTFEELLEALELDNGATYSGNGTIWIEETYNGNDDAPIVFDGDVLTSLGGIALQGGWNGDLGANFNINEDIGGPSLFDTSITFVNWTGDITINNIDIENISDNAGYGLYVDTDGDVTLDQVSVHDTAENSYGYGEGAELHTTGDVTITDSNFNDNEDNGLIVGARGTVTLHSVVATGNGLDGAFLDNCLYGQDAAGLCAGSGNLSVDNSIFSGNGTHGLSIQASVDTIIDAIQANNNGQKGLVILATDNDATGNVAVSNSQFNQNSNGAGLSIFSDGNISLVNVLAQENRTGAQLDTTAGSGSVGVDNSNFLDNTWSGLHVESGNNITLSDVAASGNGANGAYLIAEGNVSVTDSEFNDNVHTASPDDPGLYVKSMGNITLTNVTANQNEYGAGVVLISQDTGNITVTNGVFDENGTFGIQAKNGGGAITLDNVTANLNAQKGAYLTASGASAINVTNSVFNSNGSYGIYAHSVDGDIALTAVEASYNGVKGAYLVASCTCLGNIFVSDSIFIENGAYNLYAVTNEGDITLDNVTVTGNNITTTGAYLRTENGGNVFVSNSTFELNAGAGLVIVASGEVTLDNVTADQNGGNGIEIYSTYTDDCLCPGEGPVSIVVNVNNSFITNNGEYGLQVLPGPDGILNESGNTFTNNTLGDVLIDTLFTPENCPPCACGECCDPKPKVEPKDPVIIEVPFEGADPVEQDCENTSGTILRLPDGSWIKVGCPYEGYSTLRGIEENDVPGNGLGAGTEFISGIVIGLTDENGNPLLNEDGGVTLNFKIPEDACGGSFSILYWDLTLNDGEGGWLELPLFEAGTIFPIDPDNPEDERLVLAGVEVVDGYVTVTVNFPGTFILVSP
ncbi:MAG: right-handed parallel beta-helix repeat-containing protein [Anaerolineales bacterium]|nr:right-handed parallel beta-helix repeat-containing protein [Anaerolineales bacterium]